MHPANRGPIRHRSHADRIVGHLPTAQGQLEITASLRDRMCARAAEDGTNYDEVLRTVGAIFDECAGDQARTVREVDAYLDRIPGSRWKPVGNKP
jgi:hypothetical protein